MAIEQSELIGTHMQFATVCAETVRGEQKKITRFSGNTDKMHMSAYERHEVDHGVLQHME